MEYRPIQDKTNCFLKYIDLFRECFPDAVKYSSDYLDWLYNKNPEGGAVGFDAFDGEKLVAHYACIPAQAVVDGAAVRVLLSLNTATHPDYQGRGLFTKLAELTYSAGREQGFDCVYGVANQNSTPGFIRKLNFQLVGSLRASVGIGGVGFHLGQLNSLAKFRRIWAAESLAWRRGNPVNPISTRGYMAYSTLEAPAIMNRLVPVTAKLTEVNCGSTGLEFRSPLRLFIGMIPSSAKRFSFHVDIPHKLRPSPLNFIYRSLSGRVQSLNESDIFLSFLDFDAY